MSGTLRVSGASLSRGLLRLSLASVAAAGCVWLGGTRNVDTPAGYVGYVTQGSVFGETRYLGTQAGPTSTGRRWLVTAVNVSVTPYTYDEAFAGDLSVLSRDNLRVAFSVHVVWRVHPDRVKQFVEQFSTLDRAEADPEKVVRVAYDNFLREPLRTFARDELQRYDGLEIKNHIDAIGGAVADRLRAFAADTPFEIRGVVVGNIQYPAEVSDAVAQKLAATQVLERKRTEIQIAQADAERRVVEAKGIAESMDVINQKLTGFYLQHEAIDAQKLIVSNPNLKTVVYLPTGPMGVPLTGTMPAADPAHAAGDAAAPATR
jgi:regulator of protease activity HflC (stomatin/prohibitin superfamily)